MMQLRPELMPPLLDEEKVARLGALANKIDGALYAKNRRADGWEEKVAEFNRLAETQLDFEEFQDIYGTEDHVDWVRRLLNRQRIRPVADVTRDELIEVARRAMPQSGYVDCEAYMIILDANVPMPNASNMMFYPPDFDINEWNWKGGHQASDYNPTPEQIVDYALSWSAS